MQSLCIFQERGSMTSVCSFFFFFVRQNKSALFHHLYLLFVIVKPVLPILKCSIYILVIPPWMLI